MDKKSKEHVLAEVNKDRSLLKMIRRRRAKFIRHVLGISQFLGNIFEERCWGKNQEDDQEQRSSKAGERR